MSAPGAAPPVVFADATGREWRPVFDDQAVAWLLDPGGFDLRAAVAREDRDAICGLWNRPAKLAELVLIASATRSGFDDWATARAAAEAGLCGDDAATLRAVEALVYALRRAFPDSAVVRQLARRLPAVRVRSRRDGFLVD